MYSQCCATDPLCLFKFLPASKQAEFAIFVVDTGLRRPTEQEGWIYQGTLRNFHTELLSYRRHLEIFPDDGQVCSSTERHAH